jgi:CheY-like chemotaxis protein
MPDTPLSILVAEDNPGDVFLIRRAFQKLDIPLEVMLARDGAEALRLVERIGAEDRQVDLVLLDLNLPRHDGAEVLAAVRREDKLRSTPVILLTSSDSPLDQERCRRLGANHYFRKPSELAAFMELGPIALRLLRMSPANQVGTEPVGKEPVGKG